MRRTAFITGTSGQDGAYLAKLLLEKGYRVIGGIRHKSNAIDHRLVELGVDGDIEKVIFELTELPSIMRLVEKYKPDEFYNLAAQSYVASSWETPLYTADTDAIGVSRILEAIRHVSPETRFFQASTSEMFGLGHGDLQDERTPLNPRNPYGVAKVHGHFTTVNYRKNFGIHASSGILFNHESPLRGLDFVTRKITVGLAKIMQGKQDLLELGNLSARRDWGFAGDYVEGMWRMLQQEQGDDFVLASGEAQTVRFLVECVASTLEMDLEWQGQFEKEIGINKKTGHTMIVVNQKFYRPSEAGLMVGDAGKAKQLLGWEPKIKIEELITIMAKADYDRVKRDRILY